MNWASVYSEMAYEHNGVYSQKQLGTQAQLRCSNDLNYTSTTIFYSFKMWLYTCKKDYSHLFSHVITSAMGRKKLYEDKNALGTMYILTKL